MKGNISACRKRASRGAALVEFALVAVLMITALLSVVETSRFFLAYTSVTNAARCAARYAIVHGSGRTGGGVDGPSGPGNTIQVETVAKSFLLSGTINVTQATVNVTYFGGNAAGNSVQVVVSSAYAPLVSLVPLNATLSNTSRGVIVF
jgi:Flp pilus assembly protein TadG